MPNYPKAFVVFFSFLLVFIFSTLLPTSGNSSQSSPKTIKNKLVRIGFHFYKPGSIYEEAYEGIIDGIALHDRTLEQVIYRSGRNNEQAIKNLKKMDSLKLDAIISFSSAGTRLATSLSLQTPVLASVINHPIILGIKQDNESTQTSISGTSYYIDAQKQLDLYLQLFGTVSKLGMIYDSNNPAGYLAEEPLMRAACTKKNIEFVSVGATGKTDLTDATKKILDTNVDFIVIPTNLQIYNNLDIILKQTNPLKVPVVSMNKQGVESGALAALYADTYKNGRQMIKVIERIIQNKEAASEIPFQYAEQPNLIINLQSAKMLDYEFKPTILGNASIVLN